MWYWLERLLNPDVESWFILVYDGKEYVVKVVKGIGLDFTVNLTDEYIGDSMYFVFEKKAKLMQKVHKYYPMVINIIKTCYYEEEER